MRTCEDGCNGCDECTDWPDSPESARPTPGGPICRTTEVDPGGTALCALAVVDLQLLAKLLQLPEGAEIRRVLTLRDAPWKIYVHVEGAGWLTPKAGVMVSAQGTCTEYRDDQGKTFKRVIDWNFPSDELAAFGLHLDQSTRTDHT